MTVQQVAEMKDTDWLFFLRNCRRRVPPRDQLLERSDRTIDQFRTVYDANSKECLLRPVAMAAVKLLLKHIDAGCLSDPDGIDMYYAAGRTREGLTTYRCVRGTNATEVRRIQKKSPLPGVCFVLDVNFFLCSDYIL